MREESLSLAKKIFGNDHLVVATLFFQLAELEVKLGEVNMGIVRMKESIRIRVKELGNNNISIG